MLTSLLSTNVCVCFIQKGYSAASCKKMGCMKLVCHTSAGELPTWHELACHIGSLCGIARRAQVARVLQMATVWPGEGPAALVKRVRAEQLTTSACWRMGRTSASGCVCGRARLGVLELPLPQAAWTFHASRLRLRPTTREAAAQLALLAG